MMRPRFTSLTVMMDSRLKRRTTASEIMTVTMSGRIALGLWLNSNRKTMLVKGARDSAEDSAHCGERVERGIADQVRRDVLEEDCEGCAEAAADDERWSEDAARGSRPQRQDECPEFCDGYSGEARHGQAIVQHVADRVVAGAEDLWVEVADDSEQQCADHGRPDERIFNGQFIEEVFEPG